MTPPNRWLAMLAAGGAVAGGAAALGHTSSGAAAATPKTRVSVANSSTSVTTEVRRLIAETNALQSALSGARAELGRALARPGGRTLIYKSVPTSAPAPNFSGLEAQLASEQSALLAERAQLQGEQSKIAGEARLLGQRQAQLTKEATALAAEARKLSTPSTHGTTGASGLGGGGNGD